MSKVLTTTQEVARAHFTPAQNEGLLIHGWDLASTSYGPKGARRFNLFRGGEEYLDVRHVDVVDLSTGAQPDEIGLMAEEVE